MGLDTSIVIKKNDNLNSFWFTKLVDSYNAKVDDEETTEVCYWRNCYGIRTILDELLGKSEDGEPVEIFFEEIPRIVMKLSELMNPDEWFERAESIWTYDEYVDQQTRNILNLLWLGEYLKNNPEEKAYYVNNY